MAGNYTVKPGDHMSRIAGQAGFTTYKTIWDHSQNADLKAKRNPNVLNPGDQVYIPDLEKKSFDRSVDALHQFIKPAEPLKLRLVLNRMYNAPYANFPCTLMVGLTQNDLTSDGNAKIEQKIERTDADASVKLKDQVQTSNGPAEVERGVALKIGFLTPVTEVSGQVSRLANLGYYRLPPTPVDDDEFSSAVEEFQCENRLTVDGDCGPRTQAKLLSVHGC